MKFETPEQYTVEVDDGGCEKCGAGKTWVVVGPDGDAEGVSYDDYDDARYLASAMNAAFENGFRRGAFAKAADAVDPHAGSTGKPSTRVEESL